MPFCVVKKLFNDLIFEKIIFLSNMLQVNGSLRCLCWVGIEFLEEAEEKHPQFGF